MKNKDWLLIFAQFELVLSFFGKISGSFNYEPYSASAGVLIAVWVAFRESTK